MATLTTHVLDAVAGGHAAGIRIGFFRIDEKDARHQVFDVHANQEGRLTQELTLNPDWIGCRFELVFHTAEYFSDQSSEPPLTDSKSALQEVVVRISLTDPEQRIHIPLVLSPHSYTIWWSA